MISLTEEAGFIRSLPESSSNLVSAKAPRPRFDRLKPVALACALMVFGQTGGVASETAEKLFVGDMDRAELQSTLLQPAWSAAKRVRRSRLNTGLFGGTTARESWIMSRLTLNLFPDVQPVVTVARTEVLGPRRWVGYGYVENQADSRFTLAVDQGVIAATVFVPGRGIFKIVSEGGETYAITEIDPTRIGVCGSEDLPLERTGFGPVRKTVSGRTSPGLLSVSPASASNTNLVTIVDVMVVYTPEARAGAGGATAMNTLIDLAMAEANTVYQNSEANVRLRLVHRGEVSYDEDPSFATNLNRLQLKGDGFLDDVHALRDTNRADVVCLITERGDPGVAGKAFTMTEPSFAFRGEAFSVVQRSGAVGTFVFVHEICHNFGCQHDREHALDADGKLLPGAFPYSYGHRFTVGDATYRTVMAYEPGLPIPYLSNPRVLFQGVPTGLAGTTNGANNTLTISNTAPILGAFYGMLVRTVAPSVNWSAPVAESVFRSGLNLTLTVEAGDRDGRLQQVEFYADSLLVGVVTNTAPIQTNQVGSPVLLYSLVWTNVPAREYRLTARAVDDLGASSVTSASHIIVRPANDDFANRQPITDSAPTISGTTRAATVERGEATHAGNPGGRSVWYSWLAPKAGTIFLTATGHGITPLPEAYKSVSASALTSVTRDFAFEKGTFVTHATFDVVGGVSYSVAVDALEGAEGEFALSFAYEPAPANDDFVNRTLVSGEVVTLSTTNVAATVEAGEPLHTGNPGGKSVWFGWRASKAGSVIVSVSATNFFPLAEVYLVTAPNQIPTNIPPRTTVFSQTNKMTTLTFETPGGQDYALVVDGLAGLAGAFDLSLSYAAAPPNDDFAQRISIAGTRVSLETSNLYATREADEPFHAGIKDEKTQGRKSIWYFWTAPVSGPVTVTARGAGFYPLPDVYTGDTLSTLTNVPRPPIKYETTNTISTLTFPATAFRTYVLALDGFDGRSGTMVLNLATEFAPPTAELFSLSNPTKANFKLRLFGSSGQNYVVQASTNLVVWTDLFSGTFATNSASFTDENSSKFDFRYYRVLSLP